MIDIFMWAVAGVFFLALGVTLGAAARTPALAQTNIVGPLTRMSGIMLAVLGVLLLSASWVMADL